MKPVHYLVGLSLASWRVANLIYRFNRLFDCVKFIEQGKKPANFKHGTYAVAQADDGNTAIQISQFFYRFQNNAQSVTRNAAQAGEIEYHFNHAIVQRCAKEFAHFSSNGFTEFSAGRNNKNLFAHLCMNCHKFFYYKLMSA